MADSVYWIWLQLMFGVGTRRAELMMSYFAHPRDIYEGVKAGGKAAAMLLEKERGLTDAAFEQALKLRSHAERKGYAVVTPDSADYPPLLRGIYSKPAALYVKGDLSCLRDSLAIAMVGTRKHSSYGEKAAQALTRGLAKYGVCIVSGLAKGIDTVCHKAALEAGAKTIGVLGCGIDIDYPAGSGPLKRAISQNGAVVSEFPAGTPVRPGRFPIRNRIIAGMCKGTVVVEAGKNSGSILTANHALEQGRDVFAAPGNIFFPRAAGTNTLIQDGGAKLVACAEDILEEYVQLPEKQPELSHNPPAILNTSNSEPIPQEKPLREARGLPQEISGEARCVYEAMDGEEATVESLAAQLDETVEALHMALTELEIYGLIEALPGRRYVRAPSK